MTKYIWTSYHVADIPERYNLKENEFIKLFCTTDYTLQNDNINYLNRYLGELCTMYYVWKNQIKSDYVGFQHYRMLFKNIETNKDILVNNGWCDNVITFFNKGGIQSHILYQSIQYLSSKLNFSTTEITDMLTSKIICFDGNVFICKWEIFEDLCETIFGFLSYLFPNQSWKDENVLHTYILNMNKIFESNKHILKDQWYWAQYACRYNDYRYIVYFMEYFIPFYLNIKYNHNIVKDNNIIYYETDTIDNNNILDGCNNKMILCDFENKNITIDEFTKWYELNNCSGITRFYIINYKESEPYRQYIENDGLFYGKYKYAVFCDSLQNIENYENKDVYKLTLNEYIDTISYELYEHHKYKISKIKMNVALCCIGRLENKYAVEFVEYYKKLGIDHIYIGDNNYDGEEYFEDVLQQYINEEFVTIISYRNIINCQESYYENTYKDYHTLYDYMIFLDFDEFLTLVEDSNITEYLLRNYKEYDVIKLNWMIYTDNNLIYNDNRPLLERFDKPMDLYRNVQYDFPENYHCKCIVKCKFNSICFENPHIISINNLESVKICNNSFKQSNNIYWIECNEDGTIDYSLAYIKHFMFKTIDEYVTNKLRRGTIEGGVDDMIQRYKFRFFKVNEKTPEKIQYCIDHNIDSNIL